jgi:hypothetical protein
MNDPIAPITTPISQGVNRVGQLLPDSVLSSEKQAAISRECWDAHMAGADDITLRECLKSGEANTEDVEREKPEWLKNLENASPLTPRAVLEPTSIPMTPAQAGAIKRIEASQPKLEGFPGYVRDVDYGKPDPELTPEREKWLRDKVIADAKANGIDLK